HKLVKQWKVAIPLHPEWGLEPNVFYVPPLSPEALDANGIPTGEERIPVATLESLFGPDVHTALDVLRKAREQKKNGNRSDLMDLLIAYDWNNNFALGANQKEMAL